MNAFEAIAADILFIEAELERTAKEEGFEEKMHLTGKVFVDPSHEAIWYEVADEYNTTSLISRSFPERAAYGETLVSADDFETALDFPNWINE